MSDPNEFDDLFESPAAPNKTIEPIEENIMDELHKSALTFPSAATDNPTIEDVGGQLIQFPDEPLPDSYLPVLDEFIARHHPEYQVKKKGLPLMQKLLALVDRLHRDVGLTQLEAAKQAKEEIDVANSEEDIPRELRRFWAKRKRRILKSQNKES